MYAQVDQHRHPFSMSIATTLISSMRPAFLLLTPASVIAGVGAAAIEGPINLVTTALILSGALSAHISVNMLNEYYDFKSGLDLHTERTPFSGGSGALPANPKAASAVAAVGLTALLISVVIGGYFLSQLGWQLLPIGLLGCLLVLTYTQWVNRMPLLCLIAPGTGIGLLMVAGTSFVLSGHYTWPAFWIALVPFFLANNLLLLNQYPDIEPDRQAGRRHFLIVYGDAKAKIVFATFQLCGLTLMWGALACYTSGLWQMLTLIPLLPALLATRILFTNKGNIETLKPAMAMNVFVNLSAPTLLGIAMIMTH